MSNYPISVPEIHETKEEKRKKLRYEIEHEKWELTLVTDVKKYTNNIMYCDELYECKKNCIKRILKLLQELQILK